MNKLKKFLMVLALSTMLLSACNSPVMISETLTPGTEEVSAEVIVENNDAATEPASSEVNTSSACYHPYFPVSEGAFWTFQEASGQEYTLSVDQTSTDTFTLTQNFDISDLTLKMDWYCSEDGLLNGTFTQVDLFDQMTGPDDPEITFEALEWEGSTLPPVNMMRVGYSWIAGYEMAGDMTIEGVTTTTQVNVRIENTIGALEEVTVPAGTFSEAYRVDSIGQIEMVMVMGETATPLTGVQFTYSTWYVEGIGMVKSSNEYSGMESTVELIASSLIP